MPLPELVDDSTAVEDVLDDSITAEDVEAPEDVEDEEKVTRVRNRLHPDNEYIFDNITDATEGLKKLKYENDEPVADSFRIMAYQKDNLPEPKEGEDEITEPPRNKEGYCDQAEYFVLARTTALGGVYLLEALGYVSGLLKKKAGVGRKGRMKTLILRTMWEFGKLLAVQAYNSCPMPELGHTALENTALFPDDEDIKNQTQHKNFQEYFGPDKPYYHYREENGDWKPWTKE